MYVFNVLLIYFYDSICLLREQNLEVDFYSSNKFTTPDCTCQILVLSYPFFGLITNLVTEIK